MGEPTTKRKPRGKPGQPTMLTPEASAIFLQQLRSGNYLEVAAALAGVDRTTVYQWLRKGRKQPTGIYHDFLALVEEAQAHAECRLVSLVAKAAADQWQAAAWHLERKFPDRWGRKERLDVTVDSAADKAQTTAAILAGFFGAKEDESTNPEEPADGGPDASAGA
jgi:hypothetical protein